MEGGGRRVGEWMPWPCFVGQYAGGAGLQHCQPIFSTRLPDQPAPSADEAGLPWGEGVGCVTGAAWRRHVARLATEAIQCHAETPAVDTSSGEAAFDYTASPPVALEDVEWEAHLVVTPRLDGDTATHNLFFQPWLFGAGPPRLVSAASSTSHILPTRAYHARHIRSGHPASCSSAHHAGDRDAA